MVETYSFGIWIKQRRKEQHLTQRELAMRAACAIATIKKIEADERRPSVEIAQLLADALAVPASWNERFVACARGQRSVDTLAAMGSGDHSDNTSSLPTPPTSFVGREEELAEIEQILKQADCRLLTLVGPGGIGKTRLGIELAYQLSDVIEDGTVFVPLATVNRSDAIVPAIIRAMNLSLTGEEQLFNTLKQLKILVILDNCEQLGDEVAWFTRLLDQVPNIKLLATSRERLNLRGEWIFSVPEMAQQQAIELLHNSGQRSASDLDISEDEAALVCQAVENLPLAVELAAGWLNFMSCEQIVQSIQHDVDFLATNMRDIPERHRSIRAVFDYSWKMLTEQEQNALMRLSVFRGGWRAEESEAVAGANVLMLRSLIDKSLVRPSDNGRYDLHELIRQYATEKLYESGSETATYKRHAEAYIELCENILITDGERNLGQAFEQAEKELDNCRVTLRWSLDNGNYETALHLLDTTFLPWLRRGHWQEGERWHREILDIVGDEKSTWVCQGLIHLGTFLAVQGQYAQAYPFSTKAYVMAEELDDPIAKMTVAEQRMQAEPKLEDARECFETLITLLQDWDHPIRNGRLSGAYCLFGDRLRDAGHVSEAKAYYHKAIEFDKDMHGVMSVYIIGNLGRIALHEGELEEAYNMINRSIALMRANGSRVGIADWTVRLGEVLLYMSNYIEAEINFEESMALYEEIGNVRAATDLTSYLAHTAILQNNWDGLVERLQLCLPSYNRILQEFRSLASHDSAEYTTPFINALFCTALLFTHREQYEEATPILGCATLLREKDPMRPEPQLQALVEETTTELRNRLGEVHFASLIERGQSMNISDLLDYAIECIR